MKYSLSIHVHSGESPISVSITHTLEPHEVTWVSIKTVEAEVVYFFHSNEEAKSFVELFKKAYKNKEEA